MDGISQSVSNALFCCLSSFVPTSNIFSSKSRGKVLEGRYASQIRECHMFDALNENSEFQSDLNRLGPIPQINA